MTFSGDMKLLVDSGIVSERQAIELMRQFGGIAIYIPFVSGELLKELVMEEYDGTNAKEIAIKYRCSERMVQMILNQKI